MSAIKKSNGHPSGYSLHHHYKDKGILMRELSHCLKKSNNARSWQKVANGYDWQEIKKDGSELLRLLLTYVCYHPLGYIIVGIILNLEVIHFEDIEMLSHQERVPDSQSLVLIIETLHKIAVHYSKSLEQVEKIERNFCLPRIAYDESEELDENLVFCLNECAGDYCEAA
ncbi:MAG: hypothetical protein WCG84_04920 [Candidatus Moraniibacteriota bacterium]